MDKMCSALYGFIILISVNKQDVIYDNLYINIGRLFKNLKIKVKSYRMTKPYI